MPKLLRCSRCHATLKGVPIEIICNVCEEKILCDVENEPAVAGDLPADAPSKQTAGARAAGDIDSNGDAWV